jgi:hypothetical protein
MEEDARALLRLGVRQLPVLRVGRTLFPGEERLGEALLAARAAGAAGAPSRRLPTRPPARRRPDSSADAARAGLVSGGMLAVALRSASGSGRGTRRPS